MHAPPASLLAADLARRAVSFYSTSTDAQPTTNDAIESVEAPDTVIAEDGKTADGAGRVDGKEGEKEKRPRGRRISSSSKALRALRQSLAVATEQDKEFKMNGPIKKTPDGKAALARAKREARRLEIAQGKQEKKSAEKEEVKKDTVKASKIKKGAAKASKAEKSTAKAPKAEKESADRASEDYFRRTRRKATNPSSAQQIKTTEGPEAQNQEGTSLDAVKTQDVKQESTAQSSKSKITQYSTKPDFRERVSGIAYMLIKYPSILDKLTNHQNENLGKDGKKLSMRRTLVELVQAGKFSAKEKAITMKLLKTSIVHRLQTSAKHNPKVEIARASNIRREAARQKQQVEGSARPSKGIARQRIAGRSAGPLGGLMRPTKAPIQRTKGPISAKPGTTEHEIKTIEASELELTPIDKEPLEVPNLAYGLERVLFNPGVYHLQDPRSRVFNFDPYLQTIMPVSEFDFNALKQYITSSRDTTLLSKAKEEEKKYTGSTSSMTSALGHFHFLLSQWRPINTGILSQMFPVEYNTFTALQRGPVAVFLRWRDGTYAIDADKEYDDSNILMMLGKSMEKLLTLSTNDFEKYRKANSDQISEEQRNESEPFHYTTIGDFLLRSQLDAHDPRLPGTGMFDLKTRAVISVRMDTSSFEEGRGYQIRGRHGEWESFEREYYDMIRSAFLKYSLQVRMGRMDGIFVAFHNTERIFGFQYISLPEMDYALHGTENTAIGDSEFKLSLELLNRVLDRATARFPKQSLRLHFETRDGVTPFMYIFAEPVEEKVVEKIQATNKRKIEEFEREVLGVTTAKLTEEQKEAEWTRLRAKVEERLQQDELGIESSTGEAETKRQAELDELSAQEQQMADELLPATAIEEDGEDNEVEEEDVLIDESEENDEESLEEEEGHEENEETAIEDGDEILEENELDEQAILDETIADDAEESDKSLEEQDLDEQDTAAENLPYDLEDMEESESLEEQDLDEQASAEDIVAQDLEEAHRLEEEERLEESAAEDETLVDEESNEDDLESQESKDDNAEQVQKVQHKSNGGKSASEALEQLLAAKAARTAELLENAGLKPEGTLSGSTIKEAVLSGTTRKSKSRASKASKSGEFTESTKPSKKPLLAMTLVIRNKVNNKYVERPEDLEEHEKWEVEYALSEVPKLESAQKLYQMTKTRRFRALTKTMDLSKANAWNDHFIASIKKMSETGRLWREKQDKIEKQLPVKVLEVKGGKKMDVKDRDVWHQGKKEE
jgi:hypothetical protein